MLWIQWRSFHFETCYQISNIFIVSKTMDAEVVRHCFSSVWPCVRIEWKFWGSSQAKKVWLRMVGVSGQPSQESFRLYWVLKIQIKSGSALMQVRVTLRLGQWPPSYIPYARVKVFSAFPKIVLPELLLSENLLQGLTWLRLIFIIFNKKGYWKCLSWLSTTCV